MLWLREGGGGLYRGQLYAESKGHTGKSSDRYRGTGRDGGGCKSALLQGNSFSHLCVDSRLLNLPLRYRATPILHSSVHEAHHQEPDAWSLPEHKSAKCGMSLRNHHISVNFLSLKTYMFWKWAAIGFALRKNFAVQSDCRTRNYYNTDIK